MDPPLIYHNPRCAKSRATLALLRQRGFDPIVIDNLESPPSAAQLTRIANLMGVDVRQLLRTEEPAYAELGLSDPQLDNDELLRRVIKLPALIQRPIVLANGKAAVGRPPEAILPILAP
ncbi:MAG: arsenate reductase (glutaredoxin) [Tahibacter sp.]